MSLWADIDTYLETQIRGEMGTGGNYTTLQVRQVLVDEMLTIEDMSTPVIQEVLPVVLVRSHRATQQSGQHGGGVVNVENIYEYYLVAVVLSTGKRQAKQDVQEMRRRMRDFLRTRLSLGGLTSADNEHVQRVTWGASSLEVWLNDKQPGTFYGVAALDFKVQSI